MIGYPARLKYKDGASRPETSPFQSDSRCTNPRVHDHLVFVAVVSLSILLAVPAFNLRKLYLT